MWVFRFEKPITSISSPSLKMASIASISKVSTLFSHDHVTLSSHKPAVNYLANAIHSLALDRGELLLALPHARSEVIILHGTAADLRFRAVRPTLALPERASLRALTWVHTPEGVPPMLAVALSDRILLYRAGLDAPVQLADITLPAGSLPTCLHSLRGADAHLHLVFLTSSSNLYYLHIRTDSWESHLHHVCDGIRLLTSTPSGVQLLDKADHLSFYSCQYIHSLSVAAHSGRRALGNHLVHPPPALAMVSWGDTALVSYGPPTSLPTVPGNGFKHVLAGVSLIEALSVPSDVPLGGLEDLMHLSTHSAGPSHQQHELKLCAVTPMPAGCQHHTSSLEAKQTVEHAADLLASHPVGGGDHLLALASASSSTIQIHLVTSKGLQADPLNITLHGVCRGLAFLAEGESVQLLVLKADRPASEALVALSTSRDFAIELVAYQLALPSSASASAPAPAQAAPVAAPQGLDPALIAALGGLSIMLSDRFGALENLLNKQQDTITTLQEEIKTLKARGNGSGGSDGSR